MGDDFTCVLVRPEKKVYCYGANDQGQLGAGGNLDEYKVDPVPLKFEEPVLAIQAEGDFACLIRSMDKSLWCWGAVPVLAESYSSPREIYNVKGVSKMTLGADRGCVIFLNDTIQCFGESFTESSTTPLKDIEVTLSEGEKVVDLKFHNAHCCLLLNNGRIMCFGYNGSGQLGDGTTTDRYDKAS
jgi:alpha-tubulin suppressor-like RCC1 family protein